MCLNGINFPILNLFFEIEVLLKDLLQTRVDHRRANHPEIRRMSLCRFVLQQHSADVFPHFFRFNHFVGELQYIASFGDAIDRRHPLGLQQLQPLSHSRMRTVF